MTNRFDGGRFRWVASRAGGALCAALVVAGCGGGTGAPAPATAPAAGAAAEPAGGATITDAVRKRAKLTFSSTCATCHGETGKGDGPGAAALDPKPRAFGDKEWQKSVTDEHIEKAIVYGGAAVGKTAQMPAHPMFKDQKALLAALREIVRGFGQDGGAAPAGH
jgi:mono/diheme cytochrome c family protein